MKQTRSIFTILLVLVCFFSTELYAQEIQTVTPNNATASALEIKEMFGDLINVSASDIKAFYSNQWPADSYSNTCAQPEANITDMNENTASFEWEHVGSNHYRVSYLRLSSGQSGYQNTTDDFIDLNIPNDLYLVTFQSKCGGGYRSALDIIIIEKAVMFTSKECNCSSYNFLWQDDFPSTTSSTGYPTYEWPTWLTNGDYLCTLNYDGGGSSYFRAQILFDGGVPVQIGLYGICLKKMGFYEDKSVLYAYNGDKGGISYTGHFTFGYNNALTFIPQAGVTGTMTLKKCRENNPGEEGVKARASGSDDKIPEFLTFNSLANPFIANTTLQYALPVEQEVSITLFNAYGQRIRTIKEQELTTSGTHQLDVDLSNQPGGIYFCILKTPKEALSLKLLKTE